MQRGDKKGEKRMQRGEEWRKEKKGGEEKKGEMREKERRNER